MSCFINTLPSLQRNKYNNEATQYGLLLKKPAFFAKNEGGKSLSESESTSIYWNESINIHTKSNIHINIITLTCAVSVINRFCCNVEVDAMGLGCC